MPVIKSAKKKLRQDRKREERNNELRNSLKTHIKKTTKAPTETLIKKTMSVIDKATKENIIHKNKAARMKSKLSKLLKKEPTQKSSSSRKKK